MYNTNSKSRNVKIAIAAICVIILALCIVFGSTNNASAMNSVNDAQNNEVVIEAVDATTATDATETETESTESTEATEADVDEDEEEKEVIEVPVYIYVPQETEPETTVPPTTEPKEEPTEETKPYEELPEATKPEEETKPEETKPEETQPAPEETKPAHVHDFCIVWTKVAPTCTANGYTLYICNGCTETEKRDFEAPIDHNYIVYEGKEYNTHWCSNCGDTYQVEVETPAPADETVPVETEPVEETEPAPAHTGHTCDPSDGHNHKEVKMGPFTYVYCEKVTEATKSADGRIEYFPYSWCL